MGLTRSELRLTFIVGKFTFVKKKSTIAGSLGYSEVYKKEKNCSELLLISCKEYNRELEGALMQVIIFKLLY